MVDEKERIGLDLGMGLPRPSKKSRPIPQNRLLFCSLNQNISY